MHSSIGYFYSSIDHWHGGLENPPSYERRALIDDPAGEVYSERMSAIDFPEFMRGLAVAAVLGGFSAMSYAADIEPTQLDRNHAVTDVLPDGYFQESYVHNAMATYFEIVMYGKRGKDSPDQFARAAEEAFKTIDSIESRASSWIRSSQTSRVNREAADYPVRVAPDVFRMIQASQTLYRDTGGAFDVTVGPLIDLWRTCRNEKRLPTESELSAARGVIGFDKVTLDAEARTVSFAKPGLRLNFGGIGKGFALDQAAEVLRGYGVRMAILHGGASSILAMGAPPDKPGWTVRVSHPVREDEDIATFVLNDESLSTSGHLIDVVEIDGKKYGHILNPATGMPVEGIMMTMAVAPTGTETDGLSTAFFVMGIEETERYCREHPGVRAVLIPDSETGTFQPIRIGFSE
jgi:thiamine biosynthesis lipoprotein